MIKDAEKWVSTGRGVLSGGFFGAQRPEGGRRFFQVGVMLSFRRVGFVARIAGTA